MQTNLPSKQSKAPYLTGFLLSLAIHLVGAVAMIIVLETRAASAAKPPEVFTVTLEGGKKIGGVSQVPKNKKKSKKALPNNPANEKKKKQKATKKLEKPSVVDDPEKIKKEKAARKKKEAAKKKKKAQAAKKKKAADRKRKEKEKKEREQRLKDAIERSKNRYDGESASAGGQGFGAARVGGEGMGGGTLASMEFIAYRNALEGHIKAGWRWLAGGARMQAQVLVTILPTGVIQGAQIVSSSGNTKFDDSVLRAVYKASPVPPAPAQLYSKFREVRITFDSQN